MSSSVEGSEEDLTRKQRREQARAQRKALEQAERARAVRRKRLTLIGGPVGIIAMIVVVAIIATSGGGSQKAAPVAGSGASAGLQVTPAPWAPEYGSLSTRLAALHLPTQTDSAYHVHAALRVHVNGQQVTVPANIGIDPQGQFLASLHTHNTSGVIHIESSE